MDTLLFRAEYFALRIPEDITRVSNQNVAIELYTKHVINFSTHPCIHLGEGLETGAGAMLHFQFLPLLGTSYNIPSCSMLQSPPIGYQHCNSTFFFNFGLFFIALKCCSYVYGGLHALH